MEAAHDRERSRYGSLDRREPDLCRDRDAYGFVESFPRCLLEALWRSARAGCDLREDPRVSAGLAHLHELDHQPVNPEAAPSRRVRRLWLMTLLAILVAAVLMILEVFDFAPCVIGAFCF